MPQPFTINENFATVLRGLLEIHRLDAHGQLESPEADAIRDAMDGAWHALSDVERKRLGGLSEDLNAMIDPAAPQAPIAIDPQAQEKLNQAHEARERGDWDRALELLRRWGRYVQPALLAYLRGTIWRAAGDPSTAAVFFEHACLLDPKNDNFQAVRLHPL